MTALAGGIIAVLAVSLSAVVFFLMRPGHARKAAASLPLARGVHGLAYKVGRRGAFLTFLAVLDFAYAWALHLAAVAPLRARPDLLLPLPAWAWIWAATGAVCLSGVFLERDRFQYAAASGLKAAWASVYASLWLSRHVTGDWISVVVWMSFAVTVLLVGSWPEQPAPGAAR